MGEGGGGQRGTLFNYQNGNKFTVGGEKKKRKTGHGVVELLWRLHKAPIDGVSGKQRCICFLSAAGSHAINTNCSAAHSRQALSCKMAVEYDKFIESRKKSVLPLVFAF